MTDHKLADEEAVGMGRVAKTQQQARAKARQRRIVLDHDRAARDDRVEAIAAEAILALGERDDALRQVRDAEVRAGEALRRIVAEGVTVEGAAQLCDLAIGDVHRLRRQALAAKDSRVNANGVGNGDSAGPEPMEAPSVTLRANGALQS